MRHRNAISILLLLIGGCDSQKKAQKAYANLLTSRFHSIAQTKDFSDDKCLLLVSALVSPVPVVDTTKPNPKTAFDLQGQGQKQLLSVFAEKDKDAQKRINDELNLKFQTPPDDSQNIDLSQPAFSIVLSVNPKDFYQNLTTVWSPGDRIQSLKISIVLSPETQKIVEFKTWDKLLTQYATYNAASVSYTKSKALNIAPSVSIAGSTFSIGSYNLTNGYAVGDTAKYPIVIMTGTLKPDSIAIQQDGSPTISLFGNTTITITPDFKYTIPTELFDFDGLTGDNGVIQEPAKVKLKRSKVMYPSLLGKTTTATLKLDYEIRHVINNAATIEEGDDDIQFYTGHKEWSINPLFKCEDITPVLRTIQNDGNIVGLYDDITGYYYEINLKSYHSAEAFYSWLMATAPKTADFIKIGDYKITASMDQVAKKPTFLNSNTFVKNKLVLHTDHSACP